MRTQDQGIDTAQNQNAFDVGQDEDQSQAQITDRGSETPQGIPLPQPKKRKSSKRHTALQVPPRHETLSPEPSSSEEEQEFMLPGLKKAPFEVPYAITPSYPSSRKLQKFMPEASYAKATLAVLEAIVGTDKPQTHKITTNHFFWMDKLFAGPATQFSSPGLYSRLQHNLFLSLNKRLESGDTATLDNWVFKIMRGVVGPQCDAHDVHEEMTQLGYKPWVEQLQYIKTTGSIVDAEALVEYRRSFHLPMILKEAHRIWVRNGRQRKFKEVADEVLVLYVQVQPGLDGDCDRAGRGRWWLYLEALFELRICGHEWMVCLGGHLIRTFFNNPGTGSKGYTSGLIRLARRLHQPLQQYSQRAILLSALQHSLSDIEVFEDHCSLLSAMGVPLQKLVAPNRFFSRWQSIHDAIQFANSIATASGEHFVDWSTRWGALALSTSPTMHTIAHFGHNAHNLRNHSNSYCVEWWAHKKRSEAKQRQYHPYVSLLSYGQPGDLIGVLSGIIEFPHNDKRRAQLEQEYGTDPLLFRSSAGVWLHADGSELAALRLQYTNVSNRFTTTGIYDAQGRWDTNCQVSAELYVDNSNLRLFGLRFMVLASRPIPPGQALLYHNDFNIIGGLS